MKTSKWALEEFGRADLGDARWERRLVEMATTVERRPAGTVTEAFRSAAERQGAYGLLESPRVTARDIAVASWAACAERASGLPYVVVPIDGSSLSLDDPTGERGMGIIGAGDRRGRGLKVISALGLTPDGAPLGILSQVWWTREAPRLRASRARGLDDKETKHWLGAMTDAAEMVAAHAPSSRCWVQIDREGDNWHFLDHADRNGLFTIRAAHDRRVLGPDGRLAYLHETLTAAPLIGTIRVEIPPAHGRTGRQAVLVLRAMCVTISWRGRRRSNKDRRLTRKLNVVWAREVVPPSEEQRLDWKLLTNASIRTPHDVKLVLRNYTLRWRIEEFHRTWKSAHCRVEETQLRSVEATTKWATILAAVAARTERLKHLARTSPDEPPTVELTPIETRALVLLRRAHAPRYRNVEPPTTIAEAVLWIAELGGYTGKSSGGPPGSVTIARGLEELRVAVALLEVLEREKK